MIGDAPVNSPRNLCESSPGPDSLSRVAKRALTALSCIGSFSLNVKLVFIDDTQEIKTGKLFLVVIIIHLFTTTAWTNDFTITFLGMLLVVQNNIKPC